MDHVVYVDTKEKELDKLLSGEKSMIIRGAAGRKLPYGRVEASDVLWFVENKGDGLVKGKATAKSVYNSEKLTEQESEKAVLDRQEQLRLTPNQIKRWSGKRYLVLIEIEKAQRLEPFAIDRSEYGNMDDWLPVGDIGRVRL
ncbi:MAG: hypothetical protein BWY11_02189 [Firmicutes bacterium ADurb.Bin182]|nr:MAG: hypothetical protein BWY11_02189 [Firmicutes bacterium ADurb.Bin182]